MAVFIVCFAVIGYYSGYYTLLFFLFLLVICPSLMHLVFAYNKKHPNTRQHGPST